MRDLTLAKNLLSEGDCTCVLCKGEQVYTSRKTGISPMLDWLDAGEVLAGFSAADKIVGKAAAMLFTLAGVRKLHAQVLSEAALQYLEAQGIFVSYETVTPGIINRSGSGICPMEETVMEMDDPAQAFAALKQKREQLRKGAMI